MGGWAVAALVTLPTWVAAVVITWVVTRPDRTGAVAIGDPRDELPPPEDESTLAVLRAVSRSRKDEHLPAEVVRGALNALHRRELLTVQSHLGALWLRPTPAGLPWDLPAHERTLLERVTACATRLPGPIPLGALMPGPAAGPRPWAGQMADSAREDAMARKLVRARVRAPLRVLLVVWGLAPPVLLFAAFWTSSPVTADNAEAYANATILGVIALAGVLQGCLYWTGSVVLSPTGRTALSRAPAEPAVHALEDAEMPVSYLEGEVWSTATGAWRRLLVRNDHPRGAVRSPLPVWGRVVRCIPKSDDRPCYLVVDDTVGDVAYKYRVTPYQFERAPLGSWVSLRVPHGRRSFSDVTVKGAGQ